MSQSLLESLLSQIKTALKAGEKEKLLCLRGLHSEVKNIGINKKVELTDEVVIDVATKAVKQRKESIELFKKGAREDLVSQNEQELVWLRSFLPKQLSESEVMAIVDDCLKESGVTSLQEMGKIMPLIMPRVKGKADGNLVKKLVSQRLNSK